MPHIVKWKHNTCIHLCNTTGHVVYVRIFSHQNHPHRDNLARLWPLCLYVCACRTQCGARRYPSWRCKACCGLRTTQHELPALLDGCLDALLPSSSWWCTVIITDHELTISTLYHTAVLFEYCCICASTDKTELLFIVLPTKSTVTRKNIPARKMSRVSLYFTAACKTRLYYVVV